MCGLFSAIRKVNIDGPGGKSPSNGSADAPTYSVTVSAEEARAANEAWYEKKNAGQTTKVKVSEEPSIVSSGLEILPNLFLKQRPFDEGSQRGRIFQ